MKMTIQILVFFGIFYYASSLRELPYITSQKDADGKLVYEIKISQPNVKVYNADQYFCFTKVLEEIGEAYVLNSYIEYDHRYIHHVSTSFCDEPADFAQKGPWDCTLNRDRSCPGSAVTGHGVDDFINEREKLIQFPKDVSIRVGSLATLRFFMFESHFKSPVTESTHPLVNITLTFIKSPTRYLYQTNLMITSGQIPSKMDKGFNADIACPWNKPEVVAFGVTLHTHHYGYMAELFRIRNGTWTLLASQLTQDRPKVVTPLIGGLVDIKPGDILAARCLYINKGDKPVKFGLSDKEEMCNVNVNFGYELKDEHHFTRTGACVTNIPEFSFCDHDQTEGICVLGKVPW